MHSVITFFRTALLLLICGFYAAQPARAQEFADHIVPNMAVGLISDDYKAADKDPATAAVLKPTALLSATSLRVAFKSKAKIGQPAGVYIKSANALNVEVLGVASINTYLGTKKVATYYTSNLLALAVGNSDMANYSFVPTESFDQIEVQYYSALAVGKDVAFYEAYITPATPLPVVLTAFGGKATPAGVALSWETASELNTARFVVERASGAGTAYQALGQVAAAGNSLTARRYQFVDASAPAGLHYYRLRQIDLDGQEVFSPVVAVQANGPASALTTLTTYPNPATETLTIVTPAGARLAILNQLGQTVQVLEVAAGQQPVVDISRLPGGVYFLRDAASGQRTRFVKAEMGGR